MVEILVVMAVLSVLFALATGAVMRGLQTAEDAAVGIEIRQLENGIAAFKAEFGTTFVPSTIILRNNLYFDPANPIEKRTKDFLAQMFPRMQFAATNDGTVRVLWAQGVSAADAIPLVGPECLVFFLGGRNGLDGWSKNPTDPWNGSGTRTKPFYEFSSERVRLRQGQRFPCYLDRYNRDQPYVYFSAYKAGNDYSYFDTYNAPRPNGEIDVIRAFFDYKSNRFHNPNSFQIISAGRDGLFGQFNLPPANANVANPADKFVKWNNGDFQTNWLGSTAFQKNAPLDNICNFHNGKMGTPQ